MKLTKDIHHTIPATFTTSLPGENQWCVARVRCRDGSLYIWASINLQFTLVRLVQAKLGITDVEGKSGVMQPLTLTGAGAVAVVHRAGGIESLDGFIRCSDKASAMSLCKSWKEGAVKRGLKLAEEVTTEEKGRELFGDSRTPAEKADF
ncbi:MAG: hypothetical protein E6I36_13310 [Chloroflexi bacterium]|nr:MAG: hypothetical protein E6I36_13310 [Chloroflexota bacterium]